MPHKYVFDEKLEKLEISNVGPIKEVVPTVPLENDTKNDLKHEEKY